MFACPQGINIRLDLSFFFFPTSPSSFLALISLTFFTSPVFLFSSHQQLIFFLHPSTPRLFSSAINSSSSCCSEYYDWGKSSGRIVID
ncbi:hypothetical protein VN97_g4347 [Penicillium thymicola]|uniref:Uncharacterized protein n=1 Tax=Penicillium thymicola TaxID=293382 RepID=A0AAI9TKU7_PENTH|nr:hypothetical protein VN97_g4347 [Penicillium thymicola]